MPNNKFGGIETVALQDNDNPAAPVNEVIVVGGIRNSSTLTPDWIRDEETTMHAFGGGTLAGELHIRSLASYDALENVMEDEKQYYLRFDYTDGSSVITRFPMKLLVRKDAFVNASDGKRGITIAFHREAHRNILN